MNGCLLLFYITCNGTVRIQYIYFRQFFGEDLKLETGAADNRAAKGLPQHGDCILLPEKGPHTHVSAPEAS